MTKNKTETKIINISINNKSTLSKILKYLLILSASIILLILFFGIWIYLSLIAGPSPFEMNDFHPYKSPKAKMEYLAYENRMAETWPVISEEKKVITSFGTTFMRVSGPVDAPPLILLPGGGSNSYIWNANIKEFSKEYRTYALDNIYDWGRSVYIRKIDNGQDYTEWLNELFDTLKFENNIRIVGYSYGGWVTSQYAIYHPERLKHVVLVAPAWTVQDVPDQYMIKMLKSLLPIRAFKKEMMHWVWKDLLNSGENGRKLVEDRIDYYEMAMKCFKLKTGVKPTVLTDSELEKLKTPILYLVGENETCYNADSAITRLHKVAPRIETQLIHNTGHDLMFTHTELVNKRILDFLNTD